jgi:hypothetical protein
MSNLSEWQTLAEYQAERSAKFPSKESLRWQIRVHKGALIEAAAISELAGRTHLHPQRADAVFIEAGTRRLAEAA